MRRVTWLHCPSIFRLGGGNIYPNHWKYMGLMMLSKQKYILACWDCGFETPPEACMSLCCECYVLSGRGLCLELITRPEESHRLWCVVVCDLETSWMRRPWPALSRSAKSHKYKTIVISSGHFTSLINIFIPLSFASNNFVNISECVVSLFL